jgi:hypothetical protein
MAANVDIWDDEITTLVDKLINLYATKKREIFIGIKDASFGSGYASTKSLYFIETTWHTALAAESWREHETQKDTGKKFAPSTANAIGALQNPIPEHAAQA